MDIRLQTKDWSGSFGYFKNNVGQFENENINIKYMGTTNLTIMMIYALVILAMVVGLFVLDTSHHRSNK